MGRVGRIFRLAGVALSALAAAAVLGGWAWSFRRAIVVGYGWRGERCQLVVSDGGARVDNAPQVDAETTIELQRERLILRRMMGRGAREARFKLSEARQASASQVARADAEDAAERSRLDQLQQELDARPARQSVAWSSWLLPPHAALPVAVLFGVPPILAVLRIRRDRHRRRAGLCGACGYDLRASAGRCPECGDVAVGDGGGRVGAGMS